MGLVKTNSKPSLLFCVLLQQEPLPQGWSSYPRNPQGEGNLTHSRLPSSGGDREGYLEHLSVFSAHIKVKYTDAHVTAAPK